MTKDALKQAEQRGYARGYRAGKHRADAEQRAEAMRSERQAFLERAFLAALSACVNADNWKSGGEPITNIPGRTALAWDFAEEALKRRRYAP